MESIIRSLGTNAFTRIRIGIGSPTVPGFDIVRYVLDTFHVEERPIVEESVSMVVLAIEVLLSEGMGAAMSRFNQK